MAQGCPRNELQSDAHLNSSLLNIGLAFIEGGWEGSELPIKLVSMEVWQELFG